MQLFSSSHSSWSFLVLESPSLLLFLYITVPLPRPMIILHQLVYHYHLLVSFLSSSLDTPSSGCRCFGRERHWLKCFGESIRILGFGNRRLLPKYPEAHAVSSWAARTGWPYSYHFTHTRNERSHTHSIKGTPPRRIPFLSSCKLLVTSDFHDRRNFPRKFSNGVDSCASEVVAALRPSINVGGSFPSNHIVLVEEIEPEIIQ